MSEPKKTAEERTLIAREGEYELWHEGMCASVPSGEPTGLHTIRCRRCGKQLAGGQALIVELMWRTWHKDARHEGCPGDA